VTGRRQTGSRQAGGRKGGGRQAGIHQAGRQAASRRQAGKQQAVFTILLFFYIHIKLGTVSIYRLSISNHSFYLFILNYLFTNFRTWEFGKTINLLI